MKQAPVSESFFADLRCLRSVKACGGQAAFLVRRACLQDNRNHTDLWLLQKDKPRRLTEHGRVLGFWWLDSATLVYARAAKKPEGNVHRTRLFRIDLKSEREALWCRLGHEVQELAFLPGGGFAFTAAYDPEWESCLQRAGGHRKQALEAYERRGLATATERLPFWDNGEGYRGFRATRLYLWDGKAARALTPPGRSVESFRLCEGGRALAYSLCDEGSPRPFTNRLLHLSLEDFATRDISVGPGFTHAAFVPAGPDSLVVCGAFHDRHGLNQNPGFYRVDTAKGAVRPLYEGGGYNFGDAVASDVRAADEPGLVFHAGGVYFPATLGGSTHLMRLCPESGDIRQATAESGAVQQAAVCGDSLLFTALRGGRGQELYRLDGAGGETRLTHFNDDPLAKTRVLRPTPLCCTTSGGQRVEGWVLQPAGPLTAKSRPAVLNIHGGPKMAYGDVLFHEMQLLAARGYGVLYCNPVGSEGRGDDFADIRGGYGGGDYDDLMDFLDAALAAHPWIDPDALAVSGGSYGGYMVNLMISRTRRFRAAVSQRGISSWLGLGLGSDIGYAFVPDQTGAGLDEPETLWAASPLAGAAQVTTPTLFLHSDEDCRCPLDQGAQMYAALKNRGVPARLCVFHGENHDLSRSGRPQARLRRLEEILGWLGRYLPVR